MSPDLKSWKRMYAQEALATVKTPEVLQTIDHIKRQSEYGQLFTEVTTAQSRDYAQISFLANELQVIQEALNQDPNYQQALDLIAFETRFNNLEESGEDINDLLIEFNMQDLDIPFPEEPAERLDAGVRRYFRGYQARAFTMMIEIDENTGNLMTTSTAEIAKSMLLPEYRRTKIEGAVHRLQSFRQDYIKEQFGTNGNALIADISSQALARLPEDDQDEKVVATRQLHTYALEHYGHLTRQQFEKLIYSFDGQGKRPSTTPEAVINTVSLKNVAKELKVNPKTLFATINYIEEFSRGCATDFSIDMLKRSVEILLPNGKPLKAADIVSQYYQLKEFFERGIDFAKIATQLSEMKLCSLLTPRAVQRIFDEVVGQENVAQVLHDMGLTQEDITNLPTYFKRNADTLSRVRIQHKLQERNSDYTLSSAENLSAGQAIKSFLETIVDMQPESIIRTGNFNIPGFSFILAAARATNFNKSRVQRIEQILYPKLHASVLMGNVEDIRLD